ncbi:GNAT family N-acetyltransferase, partial [Streptomyces sp. NPDC002586]
MPVPWMTNVRTLEGHAAITWIDRWWPALYDADPQASAYQSPRWVRAWLRQLPSSAAPVVLAATDDGQVSAALVLARHRSNGNSAMSVLTPHAEHNDMVGPGARHPHIVEALAGHLDQLVRDGVSIALSSIPSGSELAKALASGNAWEATRERSALVSLPFGWDALPSSLRRQHAKRERRIQAGHSISYERTHTTDELLRLQPDLERLHSARWAPAGAQDPYTDWRAVLAELTDETAFIAAITIDGTLAAAQLCLH